MCPPPPPTVQGLVTCYVQGFEKRHLYLPVEMLLPALQPVCLLHHLQLHIHPHHLQYKANVLHCTWWYQEKLTDWCFKVDTAETGKKSCLYFNPLDKWVYYYFQCRGPTRRVTTSDDLLCYRENIKILIGLNLLRTLYCKNMVALTTEDPEAL